MTQVLFGVDEETDPLVMAGALADVDGDVDIVTDRIVFNRHFEGLEDGKRLQDGSGAAAIGGPVPKLGASGPFRVGDDVHMRLTGAPAIAPGVLIARLFGADAAPFGSGGLNVQRPGVTSRISLVTSGDPLIPGAGLWTLDYQVPGKKGGAYLSVRGDPRRLDRGHEERAQQCAANHPRSLILRGVAQGLSPAP